MDCFAYRPADAAKAIGVSRTHLYELIAAGKLKTYTEGRRRFIPRDELAKYVDEKLAAAS